VGEANNLTFVSSPNREALSLITLLGACPEYYCGDRRGGVRLFAPRQGEVVKKNQIKN